MRVKGITNIKRPTPPKNEDDFIRYQREYVVYLKKLGSAQRCGRAKKQITDERNRITNNWIKAGILDKNGNVAEPYKRIFASK